MNAQALPDIAWIPFDGVNPWPSVAEQSLGLTYAAAMCVDMRGLTHSHFLCHSFMFVFTGTMTEDCRGHGAYHDVVTEVTRALEGTPNDAALHFKLACAHQEHGEWKAALIECERVRRLAADRFETDFIEGKALASGGHLEAAKALLDDFLTEQPRHAGAHAERARVLLKLQKPAEAQKDFETALALEKRAPADWWLDAAKTGKAVEVLRQALLALVDDPELLAASLTAELEAQNTDEALQRVDALQKIATCRAVDGTPRGGAASRRTP